MKVNTVIGEVVLGALQQGWMVNVQNDPQRDGWLIFHFALPDDDGIGYRYTYQHTLSRYALESMEEGALESVSDMILEKLTGPHLVTAE